MRKFTNKKILKIAMQQSAIDLNCNPDDFLKNENIVVLSKENDNARKYLKLPHYCDLTSYGNNIVASVSEEYADIVKSYIDAYPIEHCFETPNMHLLSESLKPYNLDICFMAEYFLPDMDLINPLSCDYEVRMLNKTDLEPLYTSEWSNALCETRKHLDVLAFGAYDNGRLIGLAGCSADCGDMWQIGVDVLKEYRKKGIASALTSRLAQTILLMGKVPFYCCAWSNLASAKTAIKSGFRPAWVELTAKPIDTILEINKR